MRMSIHKANLLKYVAVVFGIGSVYAVYAVAISADMCTAKIVAVLFGVMVGHFVYEEFPFVVFTEEDEA